MLVYTNGKEKYEQNMNKKIKKLLKKVLTNPGKYGIIIVQKGKELTTMKKFTLATDFVRQYANNGQHMEQWVRYTLTGERAKADNLPHNMGTDCGCYQIKAARATVCKGRDLVAYLAEDKATEFIYATAEGIAYVMDKAEYIAFATEFGTLTRESDKNGGAEKIRLKAEGKALLAYLAERA